MLSRIASRSTARLINRTAPSSARRSLASAPHHHSGHSHGIAPYVGVAVAIVGIGGMIYKDQAEYGKPDHGLKRQPTELYSMERQPTEPMAKS